MKKEPKEYKKPTKLTNETAPDEKVLAWFASRGIPPEVVTQEGITQAARSFPQTNQVEKCIVFPYTVEDELVNRKYRTARKHFMLEAGAELVPWRITLSAIRWNVSLPKAKWMHSLSSWRDGRT